MANIIKLGALVSHPKFGHGTVIEIKRGKSPRVDVCWTDGEQVISSVLSKMLTSLDVVQHVGTILAITSILAERAMVPFDAIAHRIMDKVEDMPKVPKKSFFASLLPAFAAFAVLAAFMVEIMVPFHG